MPTHRRRKARPSPVLGPVKGIIDRWLAEDETRPPKQRHTARRIYERLVAEYAFQGAESTVRRSWASAAAACASRPSSP